jgi:hypothetical protein
VVLVAVDQVTQIFQVTKMEQLVLQDKDLQEELATQQQVSVVAVVVVEEQPLLAQTEVQV